MTSEIPLQPKMDFCFAKGATAHGELGEHLCKVSCLFWLCRPTAFWLTRAPSCLGDGAEPDGSQAQASFGTRGGMGGAPGREMLWVPSPAQGSQHQPAVSQEHQEELGLHGAYTSVQIYVCSSPTYMSAYALLSAPGPAYGGSFFWGG